MSKFRVNGKELLIAGHPEVYPPGDDTFLMLRAVAAGKGRALEIGTGSGIIGIYMAMRGSEVTVTDINPHAVRLARRNAHLNCVELEAVRADVFEGIRGTFGTIVFNPPYLPTGQEDATGDRWLDASVNGGGDGLLLIRRFLAGLNEHLEARGRAYLISSSLSDSALQSPQGLRVGEVASAKLEFEVLTVRQITKETAR